MSTLKSKNHITLHQQINHAFLSPKGYEGFANIKSHDGHGVYDSYVTPNKSIASGITHMNFQVSFISKFPTPV